MLKMECGRWSLSRICSGGVCPCAANRKETPSAHNVGYAKRLAAKRIMRPSVGDRPWLSGKTSDSSVPQEPLGSPQGFPCKPPACGKKRLRPPPKPFPCTLKPHFLRLESPVTGLVPES